MVSRVSPINIPFNLISSPSSVASSTVDVVVTPDIVCNGLPDRWAVTEWVEVAVDERETLGLYLYKDEENVAWRACVDKIRLDQQNLTLVTFSLDVIRIVRNGSVVGNAVARLLPLYAVGSPSSGWNELLSNPISRE